MSTLTGVSALFRAVEARFIAEETPGEVVFGWREPDKQRTAPRAVIFVPGDTSGGLGAIGNPRQVGGNPRNLFLIDEAVTVLLVARDNDAPEDELAQYTAARLLLDDFLRAVYLAAHGRFAIKRSSWIQLPTSPNQRRRGAAIELLLTVQGIVPDVAHPYVSATTDPAATISAQVSELDVSTTIEIEATP